MSAFDFVFSLFGLLLGLSLAEVMSGFGRAVKARRQIRIGWLTPLLGLLVMLDLTSFWTTAWGVRDAFAVKYLVLLGLLLFTATYYLAATLVFPDSDDAGIDLDEHYSQNKRLVVGAIFLLNIPSYVADWLLHGISLNDRFGHVMMVVFYGSLSALWLAKRPRTNLILLIVIISLYPVAGLWGLRD